MKILGIKCPEFKYVYQQLTFKILSQQFYPVRRIWSEWQAAFSGEKKKKKKQVLKV